MTSSLARYRADFPALASDVVYLDSACMSLKPTAVLDAMHAYYTSFPACAGRSAHAWGVKVDEQVAAARETLRRFINARSSDEIVFTRNTTESINLVAQGFPFQKGDEIIISDKEHNSNLLPWRAIAEKKGLILTRIPSNPDNTFSLSHYLEKLSKRTKLVALAHTSNLDGVVNPIAEIVKHAHAKGARVLIDAAQSVAHQEIDVRLLKCDYLAFSGHKMLGPTGTGVLYGTHSALALLTPLLSGGGTVRVVTATTIVLEDGPARFEAGLQDYAGIIGLAAAARYLMHLGFKAIKAHEGALNARATNALRSLPVEIIGPPNASLRSSILSFRVKSMDSLAVARLLSTSADVMVRGGMHCVHEWFAEHHLQGSVRLSFSLYNTEDDVDRCVAAFTKITKL